MFVCSTMLQYLPDTDTFMNLQVHSAKCIVFCFIRIFCVV